MTRTPRIQRHLLPLALALALALAAGCDTEHTGDDSAEPDATRTTNPYLPTDATADSDAIGDTADADAEDVPLYIGSPCDEDEACSTDLCYGVATAEGHFEPAICQARCLQLEDFSRYCDSDADCCTGRCCTGCGAREGLCVAK